MRTYFVSGKAVDSLDWMADFIQAAHFEEAHEIALAQGERKFAGRPWRLTSVTEQPDGDQPAAHLSVVGRHGR